MEPAPASGTPPDTSRQVSLPALRDEFLSFRIWHETTGSRTRYIARRLTPGPGLHTLVTSDLTELRDALRAATPPREDS